MTWQDLRYWLKQEPFIPFRIVMNSGRAREVRHPELVVLYEDTFALNALSSLGEGVYRPGEMFGLNLIERIEPLETPARPEAGSA
jgi:hypothetical protein